MKLTIRQSDFLKLIKRSNPDINGWCKCSDMVYKKGVLPMYKEIPELIDKDDVLKIVRLTEKGKVVLEYLT